MMSILIIIILLLVQLLAGWGLLTLFKLQLKPALIIPLSVIMGTAVFSIIPFLLQLFYVPITAVNVFAALGVATLLLNVKFAKGIRDLKVNLRTVQFKMEIYEWPFILLIGCIVFVSAWRCFYFPPTPVDVTTGAEAIAGYAVKEATMINSVFELTQNGNSLKPPFITCLQIIYKFAGFPLGQIWLCNVFISFIIILYHLLSATLHRIIAGLLLIMFLAIPEMYAYTFIVLYDYSSAVFFFLSVYFVLQYFKYQQLNSIAFSGLLMGINTYIRPETLLLSCCVLPLLLANKFHAKSSWIKWLKANVVFFIPTILIYGVAVYIYINYYLPVQYDISAQVNHNLYSSKAILNRFAETNKQLIFSGQAIIYYSYFIFIFLGMFLLELLFKRKFNKTAVNYLCATMAIYIFYPLLSHVLPGVSIDYTVKRAFFKMFPLMLLYMANNGLLIDLSNKIKAWEIKMA